MPRLLPPILLVLAVPAGTLLAQESATVEGRVTTTSGTPIQGACVAVDRPGCLALTGPEGKFVIRGVGHGNHQVTITAVGRKPLTRDLSVEAGRAQTVEFRLEPGPILLSDLVVTATRTPTAADKVATTIDVLTPEHIATSPARESQDLLREIPAVELPRTSSLVGGSAQIVSIRGVDEGRTVVLFDGIPVSDAWGEWIDWGRVPKNMLDRVEVVSGGTSNLYGNGAIGGVISFFSKPMAPWTGSLTLDAGSRDARHAYAAGAVPITAGLTATVSGDWLEGGGYTMLDPAKRGPIDTVSEITSRNAYLRFNYAGAGKLSWFLTGHAFGDTRHLGTPLGLTRRSMGSGDGGVTYGSLGDRSGMLALRGWYGKQTERQRSTSVRSNFASCNPSSTVARACEDSSAVARIPSTDWGASALWTRGGWFNGLLESFSLGGDFRHMDGTYFESDYSTSCPGTNCGAFVRDIQSGGDQNLSGVFAQAIAAPTNRLRIELGARVDYWSNLNGHSLDPSAGDTTYANRHKTAFSPRVGARYTFVDGLSVHAAVYQAFRAPNLAELYRKQINANVSQITIPNPDLKPESGRGYEAGADLQPLPWIQIKGTVYIANYKDFNVPTQISAGPPVIRQRLNVAKSRSKGGEVYLGLQPIQGLLFSASGSWDNDRVVSSDSTNGNRINRVPSPRFTVRSTYTSPLLGSWTVLWRHEGHTTTLQGADLAPFSVWDADAQREIVPGIQAFVSVENIGNTQYQVNISGSGTNALISYGLPRTVRGGITLSH